MAVLTLWLQTHEHGAPAAGPCAASTGDSVSSPRHIRSEADCLAGAGILRMAGGGQR